jgi:putative FmdB family regulatory protein
MPIYTFRCKECRSEQDRHLGFDQAVTDLCGCGGELSKVFQLSGVRFKGDGFYRNDNQTNRPKDDA